MNRLRKDPRSSNTLTVCKWCVRSVYRSIVRPPSGPATYRSPFDRSTTVELSSAKGSSLWPLRGLARTSQARRRRTTKGTGRMRLRLRSRTPTTLVPTMSQEPATRKSSTQWRQWTISLAARLGRRDESQLDPQSLCDQRPLTFVHNVTDPCVDLLTGSHRNSKAPTADPSALSRVWPDAESVCRVCSPPPCSYAARPTHRVDLSLQSDTCPAQRGASGRSSTEKEDGGRWGATGSGVKGRRDQATGRGRKKMGRLFRFRPRSGRLRKITHQRHFNISADVPVLAVREQASQPKGNFQTRICRGWKGEKREASSLS